MAVCEIWDVRGRLDHPIDYAENPEKTANPKYSEAELQAMVDVMEYATNKNKTEQRFFVTGVNCDPTTARDEMMITKAGWNDTSEIVCYHGFQSFKHGEVTPEQAHEVGVYKYGISRNEFKQVDIKGVFDIILFTYQGVRMYSQLMPIPNETPERIIEQIKLLLLNKKTEE